MSSAPPPQQSKPSYNHRRHNNAAPRHHHGQQQQQPQPQQRYVPKPAAPKPSPPPTLTTALRSSASPSASGAGRVGGEADGFVAYLPHDEVVAAGLGGPDAQESQAVVDLLNDALAALLRAKPREFWRQGNRNARLCITVLMKPCSWKA